MKSFYQTASPLPNATKEALGHPDNWEHRSACPMENATEIDLWKCPQCGAAVLDAYQHRDWHIQLGQ